MTHSHPQDAQKVKQGMHFVADILMKKANELAVAYKSEFVEDLAWYRDTANIGFDSFPKFDKTLWASLAGARKAFSEKLSDYEQPETVNDFGRALQVVARLACLNLPQETIYYLNEAQARNKAIGKLGELADIQEPKAKEKAAQEIIDTELRFIDRRVPQKWKDKFKRQPHQNHERQCAAR